MYHKCASACFCDSNADVFSQAVSMQGANGVLIEYTIYNIEGTSPTLTVTLQESNDLENWSDLSADTARSDIGYYSDKQTGISAQYVRLKYAVGGTNSPKCVVSSGINCSNM